MDPEEEIKKKFNEEIEKNKQGDEKDKESYEHLFLQNISNIKINIETNVPNTKTFPLTSGFFIKNDESNNDKKEDFPLSEYPFFTTEIKYPEMLLYKIPYEDILYFFFNKSFFKKSIMKLLSIDDIIINSNDDNKNTNDDNQKNGEFNIQIMLRMLFTVFFPQKSDISSSFGKFIQKESNFKQISFPKKYYTYVSINSQIFTITRVVWLNDLFNHPLYKNVCMDYLNYIKWCDSESKRSEKKIKELEEIFNKNIKKQNIEKDLRYVNNLLTPKSSTSKISQKDTLNLNSILRTIKKIDAYLKLSNKDKFKDISKNIDDELIYSNETEIPIEFQLPGDSDNFWYFGFLEQNSYNKDQVKIIVYQTNYKSEDDKFFELTLEKRLLKNYNLREPEIEKILKKLEDEKENSLFYDSLIENNFQVDYTKKDPKTLKYTNIDLFLRNGWKPIDYKTKSQNGFERIFPSKYDKDTFLKLFNEKKFISRYRGFPKDDYENKKDPLEILLSAIITLDDVISSNYIDNESLKFYKKLIEISKDLSTTIKFSKEYLKNKTIDIKKKEDFKSIEEAENLIKSIEELLEPKRESNNQNLQNILVNFSKNTNSVISFNLLINLISSCFYTFECKPINNLRDKQWLIPYINTSFQNINIGDFKKPNYEIYLHIDLVKGKLDDTNTSKIKCEYKDISLTDTFNELFSKKKNRYWLLKNHPFLDVSKTSSISQPTTLKVQPSKLIRQGGKKTIKKLKKTKLHKTRKSRLYR
jgi:hypothetical protein